MFENKEIRRMNIQRCTKILDDLCFNISKEDFSQTAVDSVRKIIYTETNMTDALDIKKKIRHIDSNQLHSDLFYSKQFFNLTPPPETVIAVCNCSADFRYFLEEVTVPWCCNDFIYYKEIVVLTNFWCTKTFNKFRSELLEFSINNDIRIGFFLVTDFSTSKILRMS